MALNRMTSFNLSFGDSEFRNRQKKVFDQLQVLENNNRNTLSNKDIKTSGNSKKNMWNKKNETQYFRGKESIFKKPQNPVRNNFIDRIPDFKKNPHKWTKYSLEDVQEITEESNKKSAMDFLRELSTRKTIEQDQYSGELPAKILFNKYAKEAQITDMSGTKDPNKANERKEKASFKNTKLVMPEYVIGQKPDKKDINIKQRKSGKGKELKLDHLFENE